MRKKIVKARPLINYRGLWMGGDDYALYLECWRMMFWGVNENVVWC